jgi:hypothetical protein
MAWGACGCCICSGPGFRLTEGIRDPKRNSPPGEPARTPYEPPSQKPIGIGVCADGLSAIETFRDAPAPNGSWDWNCDGRIERRWGPCENLTRAQCEPHTNATGAPPGFCAELRAPTGCTPRVADCGQSGFLYPCFYNADDGRCHAGGYELAQVMECR